MKEQELPIQWLKRNSIRAFLPTPVPESLLRHVVNTAVWSPSWANSQPWQIYVVSGETKQKLSSALIGEAEKGTLPSPDLRAPEQWPETMLQRIREHAKNRSRFAGLSREDHKGRFAFRLKMYRFFDAPHGILFAIDKTLSEWSLLDVGFAMQNIMIAANMAGLGTCPQASAVDYPDKIREILGLNENVKIIAGMAIGYPDPEEEINQYRSDRLVDDQVVCWLE